MPLGILFFPTDLVDCDTNFTDIIPSEFFIPTDVTNFFTDLTDHFLLFGENLSKNPRNPWEKSLRSEPRLG